MKYCKAIHKTERYRTREVMVGNIGVGGDNPVRLQSMTSSSTRDVEATIDQIIRLADAGCEIARVTVQGKAEANACEGIKNGLLQRGYTIPLVADIHFYPPAAMRVVDFVDKVRVNPGNFVDKRAQFKEILHDDASYELELERIDAKFGPLVEKCKRLNRAMRIGTNHGSLSDRIMSRYGDSPAGMVESALEFTEVCRRYDYHDIIFSMKSSNPKVMVEAYRLLAARMLELGWDYPLHLGVTEAGEGEDGRVKSAMGIGTLLLDGLGDTIRVSLTEDPWHEIDPCRRLQALSESYLEKGVEPFIEKNRLFTEHQRRSVDFSSRIGMHRDGSVFVRATAEELQSPELFSELGCKVRNGLPGPDLASVDSIVVEGEGADHKILRALLDGGIGVLMKEPIAGAVQLLGLEEAVRQQKNALFGSPLEKAPLAVRITDETPEMWEALRDLRPSVILLAPTASRPHYGRQLFDWLREKKLPIPVVLDFSYSCQEEDLPIHTGAEMGLLLSDELGEGVLIDAKVAMTQRKGLGFQILQAARMRAFKTEFISCPSCGRTLFDLQEVSERIRSKTAHLPGVKIAIMGCIVNGPGEMADADFGYVGSRPGMIDLYVGKECVERNITMEDADSRLIELIKSHGRWKEPEVEQTLEKI
jgi:(E)-4-hydroxy-3-methylbut-2-enyl-diphosphate synthase